MEFKSVILKETAIDMSARTFEGYASTWGKDSVNDVIHQGAFKKSLTDSLPAGRIKVLWQHQDPLGMPIEMSENDHGLWVKARVSRTRLGDEALELMRDGVVDRLSIGFSIPNGKSFFNQDGVREIQEVKLFEFSPVTFPANDNAVILGVKSLTEQLFIAKSKGVVIDESAELVKMLTELKALLDIKEPSKDTLLDDMQPLIVNCKTELSSLSDYVKNLRG